jgi:hypothetical protein
LRRQNAYQGVVIACDFTPQAARGSRLAGQASALVLSLRADILLMAQCCRGHLRKANPARPKNGVFQSVIDLQATINRFISEHKR